ncbi:MAG: Bax inhibitor-1 family protein [Planctomycetia bacterium]
MAPTYEWTAPETTATSASERGAFIKRTYGHLLGAVLGFVLVELLMFKLGLAEGMVRAVAANRVLLWLFVGGFLLVSWFATRVVVRSASLPMQYLALGAYVVFEAVLFVPILWVANTYAPGAITSAGLITVLGFAGLTAIAFTLGTDFSFLRGLVRWGFFCAFLAIVAALIFGFELGTWFSVIMVALAGAAILKDTSDVLLHLPSDRHVFGALKLFSSVAIMFLYVLDILLRQRR